MKQPVLLLSFLVMIGLVFAQVVFSQSSTCEPIYNGGLTCVESGNILIDKKIKHPTDNRYLDQLTSDDPVFVPDQQITFTIAVKNTGRSAINSITIEDLFPPSLIRFDDKIGKFDSKTKIFTYPIDKLSANEEKKITLKARVLKADQFPNNNDPVCLLNQARVFTERTKNNPSQDNVRFCVQRQGQITQPPTIGGPTPTPIRLPDTTKGGLPVQPKPNAKTSPKTGPEALALIALLPSGLIGFLLRKKTLRR